MEREKERYTPARPLVPVACAFAAGILLDRACGVPAGHVWVLWIAAAVVSIALFLTGRRGTAAASVAVYVLVAATGACAHQVRCRRV